MDENNSRRRSGAEVVKAPLAWEGASSYERGMGGLLPDLRPEGPCLQALPAGLGGNGPLP
jgi:hypothetical protein